MADFARILPVGRDGNGALGRVHHHGVLPVVLCGALWLLIVPGAANIDMLRAGLWSGCDGGQLVPAAGHDVTHMAPIGGTQLPGDQAGGCETK